MGPPGPNSHHHSLPRRSQWKGVALIPEPWLTVKLVPHFLADRVRWSPRWLQLLRVVTYGLEEGFRLFPCPKLDGKALCRRCYRSPTL
jgi:hypothetical protein